MESPEPQPVPSFHSRLPLASKQYTDEDVSAAKTYPSSGVLAQASTVSSHLSVASFVPFFLSKTTTVSSTVPTENRFAVCQPKRTPGVLFRHSSLPFFRS